MQYIKCSMPATSEAACGMVFWRCYSMYFCCCFETCTNMHHLPRTCVYRKHRPWQLVSFKPVCMCKHLQAFALTIELLRRLFIEKAGHESRWHLHCTPWVLILLKLNKEKKMNFHNIVAPTSSTQWKCWLMQVREFVILTVRKINIERDKNVLH